MALSRQDLTLMPCNLFLSALLPDYPLGCKRVAYDAGWLKSLHRPNVDLNRSKIVKATPRGLCTEDGREHAFDVIIFATVRLLSPFLGLRAELINSFQGSNVAEHGVGVNIGLRGEQGVELRERWRSWGGPKAYLGTAVPGVRTEAKPCDGLGFPTHLRCCYRAQFPNYLIILGPNGIAGSWGYTIGVKTEFNTLLIETVSNGPARLEHEELPRSNLCTADAQPRHHLDTTQPRRL